MTFWLMWTGQATSLGRTGREVDANALQPRRTGAASDGRASPSVDEKLSTPPYDRYWHEPSVAATARVGLEVGLEPPMVRAGHRLSAMEGRPSVGYTPIEGED